MCFSASASLGAFSIGVVCLALMLARKMYFFGVFYVSIILMQLLEYFGHLSLEQGSMKDNHTVTSLIFLLLFLQPVVFTLYAGWIKYNDKKFLRIIGPVIAAFTLFSLYLYRYIVSHNDMSISYMNKGCDSSICRIDWSFFKSNELLSLLFVGFYFFFFMFTGRYFNLSSKLSDSFSLLFTLLVLSLLYMIFVDKTSALYDLLSGFGSIWCISAVAIGPYALLVSK